MHTIAKAVGYNSANSAWLAYNKVQEPLHLPPQATFWNTARRKRRQEVVRLFGKGDLSREEIAEKVGGKVRGIVKRAIEASEYVRKHRTPQEIIDFAKRVYPLYDSGMPQKQIAEQLAATDEADFDQTYNLVNNVLLRRENLEQRIADDALVTNETFQSVSENLYKRFTKFGIQMLSAHGTIDSLEHFFDTASLSNGQLAAFIQLLADNKDQLVFSHDFSTTKIFFIKNLRKFYQRKRSKEVEKELAEAFGRYFSQIYQDNNLELPAKPEQMGMHFLHRFKRMDKKLRENQAKIT